MSYQNNMNNQMYTSDSYQNENTITVVETPYVPVQQPQNEPKKKENNNILKIIIIIMIPVVLAIVLIFTVLFAVPAPISNDESNESKYSEAILLMDSGNYEEAIKNFNALGNYSQSETKKKECYYQLGLKEYKSNNFNDAKTSLKESGSSYKDAGAYISLCDFYIAKADTMYFEFDELENIFDRLKQYSSSNVECKKCLTDSLFTIMKILDRKYENATMLIQLSEIENERGMLNLQYANIWNDNNIKGLDFSEKEGKYGSFMRTE